MLTAEETYKNILLKVNKNDTNADVDISKAEFVILYKEQKDRWLREKIAVYQSSDGVEEIEELQVKHKELKKVLTQDGFVVFELPENYFAYISSYSYCSDKDCSGVIVRHYNFKPKNENMLLENTNTQPSLEFEETVVDLSEDKLFVYKKDFSVDKTLLNFYRSVGEIDLEGYIKLDGTPSTNINPDISDINVDEILNRCAKEIIRRYENPDKFAFADERLKKEN
jgi:hypothetical protein